VERLTLEEWLRHESARYMALETEAGAMVAAEIDRLADDVRFFAATTPEQYQDRKSAYEDLLSQRKAG
jgi:hypothetical protein